MARPNRDLVQALRETADRLGRGARYRWTHMGSCNCGHLAQTVTRLSRERLHAIALERAGDWTQQSLSFCADSGLPMDHVIESMLELGLSTTDLADLEKLSNDRVLRSLPHGQRNLSRRKREDVILYMRTWAQLLEADLPSPTESTVDVESVADAGRVRQPV